jgi:isopentenyl phosphate kinase
MIFLKLGGSLITVKSKPETPRVAVIERCATEIWQHCRDDPGFKLVLGHGSGSFGHYQATKYQTQFGANSIEQWNGFVEVWASANQLNRIVLDALHRAGLPVITFPPSSYLVCQEGKIVQAYLEPIELAISAGLIPVVHGDVAFDRKRGSAIVSTEKVLETLGDRIRFDRILFAGREPGVLSSYPAGETIPEIDQMTVQDFDVTGSDSQDVTGGMIGKVKHALSLAERYPQTEIRIFSGEHPGEIRSALAGDKPGTLIRINPPGN